MKTGTKILIIAGSVLTLGGVGLATWLLLRKKGDEAEGIGTAGEGNDSLAGTKQKGESGVKYTFVEVGSGKERPKQGETIYALLDCEIEWQNHPKTLSRNRKEWTSSYKRGDVVGIAYAVTDNNIITDSDYNRRERRYQHLIKQNAFNSGKIGVLRDKNGNPATLTKGKTIGGMLTEFISSDDGKELGKIIASAVTKE
jgi:hypothetical protein